jgi:hypothetical protein
MSVPLTTTNVPSAAADLYAIRIHRGLCRWVDVEEAVRVQFLFINARCTGADTNGRRDLAKVLGRPLLYAARI